jgi:hypothetical protein
MDTDRLAESTTRSRGVAEAARRSRLLVFSVAHPHIAGNSPPLVDDAMCDRPPGLSPADARGAGAPESSVL